MENDPQSTAAPQRRTSKPVRTPEEMRAFWKAKKQEKKGRAKAAKANKRTTEQSQWSTLSAEERERIKAAAAERYASRRTAEQAHAEKCAQRVASASTPKLVFDLQFLHVMKERGIKSTVSQVKYSYAALKRSGFEMLPILTAEEESNTMLAELSTFNGFGKYPPTISVGPLQAVHPKMVYLTADSDQVLWKIEPDTAYVVGSFVDHNMHKGLTAKKAAELGIATARLPIQDVVDVKNLCRVLTINHVVDSMVKFIECGDWRTAFTECLPTRRQNLAEAGAPSAAKGDGDAVADAESSDGGAEEEEGGDESDE